MNTAAHAGTHTQNVYGSRDDSVCATFVECEKSEILNTHTQKKTSQKHVQTPPKPPSPQRPRSCAAWWTFSGPSTTLIV